MTPVSRCPAGSQADARTAVVEVSGAALAEIGLAIPAQRTLTVAVILIEASLTSSPLSTFTRFPTSLSSYCSYSTFPATYYSSTFFFSLTTHDYIFHFFSFIIFYGYHSQFSSIRSLSSLFTLLYFPSFLYHLFSTCLYLSHYFLFLFLFSFYFFFLFFIFSDLPL